MHRPIFVLAARATNYILVVVWNIYTLEDLNMTLRGLKRFRE